MADAYDDGADELMQGPAYKHYDPERRLAELRGALAETASRIEDMAAIVGRCEVEMEFLAMTAKRARNVLAGGMWSDPLPDDATAKASAALDTGAVCNSEYHVTDRHIKTVWQAMIDAASPP